MPVDVAEVGAKVNPVLEDCTTIDDAKVWTVSEFVPTGMMEFAVVLAGGVPVADEGAEVADSPVADGRKDGWPVADVSDD